MKRRWVVSWMVAVALVGIAATPGVRDELWKKVDEAQQKGLPKSAIEQLNPIIEQCLKDKAYPEAVKAIGRKIALEGNIQGNKPEEKIIRLQAEIENAPAEMKPIMEVILADWYWQYFQHNRWRFVQRTRTDSAPGKDFTTWDLPRILAEIAKHFEVALAAEAQLKKIPVADYDALLVKGTTPDTYRPTLFDVVVHEALEFYQAGEQAGSKAEDTFELGVDSPVFAATKEFLAWQPQTTDEQSVTLKAVRLYQNLLAFHKEDKDKTAFIDAELLRLNFAYNKAVGEGKDERYEAALKRFVDEWADHEVSAMALWHWATLLKGQNELTEAHALAKRAYGAFPESVGGKWCWNLMQEIESKQVSIVTERVWNEPWPNIVLNYKNVTKAYFRAVPWKFEDRLRSGEWGPENLSDGERKAILGRKADLEWSTDLPATADYRLRNESLKAPRELKPGFYFILVSNDPGFGDKDNMVSYAPVWVSDLAIVIRQRQNTRAFEGLVVEALSGAPLSNSTVQAWQNNNNNKYTHVGDTQTDADGLFRFTGVNNRTVIAVARHGDQELGTQGYWTHLYDYKQKPYIHTQFFTDRSLYRPGQTIQFKGICYRVDQQNDVYEVAPNQQVTVLFNDVNGKEIARQTCKANAWGSFSGSFTAPRSGLTGRMQIYVPDEIGRGYASVTVEEYKRPKFQVAVEAPKEAAKLDEPVEVKGKATAYTGVAIGGAKVTWRVTRGVQYPMWWHWRCWWNPPYYGESQEIAHGKGVSELDGTFKVSFVAKPDLSVEKESEPTFVYTVYADVTDTTGETRSAQRAVRAGYTALSASITAAEWLEAGNPVDINVRTVSLDGVGQAAEGVVKIYALKQPDKPARPDILAGWSQPDHYGRIKGSRRGAPAVAGGRRPEPKPDPSNPNSWELGEMVAQMPFKTDESGSQKLQADLKAGIYRAMLETRDRFGKAVTARLPVQVVDIKAGKFAVKIPNHVASPKWSVEPGESFLALWGTGYDQGRAYMEIEHRGKIVKAFWTGASNTQEVVEYGVTEAMRGGLTMRVTYVRENRGYVTQRQVMVPWSNKKLDVKWERFVSKLEPGQKETWTAIVSDPEKKIAPSEMVAALYDASLDAYLQHSWMNMFSAWRYDWCNMNSQFENRPQYFQGLHGSWPYDYKHADLTYRSLPHEITANLWGYGFLAGGARGEKAGAMEHGKVTGSDGGNFAIPASPVAMMARASARMDSPADGSSDGDRMRGRAKDKRRTPSGAPGEPEGSGDEGPDLSKVTARKNLNETAFFFPHILADSNGVMKMEFTMPEALTEWKFMGFAHDAALRSGALQDKAVTSKELMVEPNPPRFVREGDEIEFTVKVSNKSAARQTGTVRLALSDARTLKNVDSDVGNKKPDQAFDVPAGESRTFSWRLTIPDGLDHLTYKAVGSTGRLSDGEENYLPVLSRRILVTESLPLPVRGKQTKDFKFDRLLNSGKSKTLKSETLTVQMVSQPAWYAVMALPYLMEFPHECTEQTFNRLYANALAKHIAGSDPKIRRVFEQWKGTEALDSPMEKNQDLKSVMIDETPWLRQAKAESQARRDVGILFDENRLNNETARLLKRMADLQLSDGRWPWFPGGHPCDYITLYITTGYGRLRHLGVKGVDMASAVKSLDRLDQWVDEKYRDILKSGHKDENHLNPTIAFYLYGRSFFLEDKPIGSKYREALDYWLGQAKKYWLKLDNRQSQGHLAVALKRWGDKETALGIMASIKERSVTNEEMGMFWRETELSWWWYRAPIETQAMMIEALDEVLGDAAAVEECRVWLLKQKQTQDWKTTKATADAIYGLLLRGGNWLASDALVEVSLGGEKIKPEKVEAGTGFYEQRFVRKEIVPDMGRIKVVKTDDGVSWGSVHWQYMEDMTKVTAYEGTPLKVAKRLFVKENTKKGQLLKAVDGPLAVGDELVVRIEVRVDRDMEYVHLKDQRGSGTEPVNVLSRYRYQDGLAYYESTKDTASHFFIDYLPKGVYVFEYSSRIQHRGSYQTGIASIQCMYAPEFNSHSESINLEAK